MPSPAADPRVKSVVVLGSPRTGTSLTASILSGLGYHVDGGLKDEFNERGYWEDLCVVTINDVILNHFGGTLEAPPPLPRGWEGSEFVRRLDGEAAEIVAGEARHGLWALKDPRFSLTLPFWKRFLPRGTVFLVCLRRPELAALSMRRSFGMDLGRAAELWRLYTAHALRNTEGDPRLLVDYDDYFTDFGLCDRIRRTLRAPDGRSPPGAAPALRHFGGLTNGEGAVGTEATRLYELMKEDPNAACSESQQGPPLVSTRSARRHMLTADLALLVGIRRVTRLRMASARFRVEQNVGRLVGRPSPAGRHHS